MPKIDPDQLIEGLNRPTCEEFAALAGTDARSLGCMLDPKHPTAPSRTERVLRVLGQQLVVEVEPA